MVVIHKIFGLVIFLGTIALAVFDADGQASGWQVALIIGSLVVWFVWGCRICARDLPEHGSGWDYW
jgi:hypothetical protein